jgi:hypothetical protein
MEVYCERVYASEFTAVAASFNHRNDVSWDTYHAVEFHFYGYAGDGHGFGVGVVAVLFGLDGGEHHEGAVAGEEVGDEAVVSVCVC